MTQVTLSLIAHTNVGKTTLARTLLRRDVGEVLDQAHVTDVSEAYELIEAAGHRLTLWDTPGFGDSKRLLDRLRREESPIGWLLHQAWDRFADRPLWCSQEAVRNVRNDADVVLYLVNAAEDPQGASYVALELEILDWLKKPVLVLLNQTGADEAVARAGADAWRAALAQRASVRAVLELDAFSRCWVQEGILFDAVAAALSDVDVERAKAMRVLATAWNERQRAVFTRSVERAAAFLAEAARDRETLSDAGASRAEQKRATGRLAARLAQRERELWDAVIADHGLDGRAAVEVARSMEDVEVEGVEPLDAKQSALLGSILSGALGGLAADLMTGGLSFGGGLVAGALLGALGGAGLSHGFRLVRAGGAPEVRWSAEFRTALSHRTALRYVAVAHSGRGRGPFVDAEPVERWRDAVGRALGTAPLDESASDATVAARLERALSSVLIEAYPAAARVLGR